MKKKLSTLPLIFSIGWLSLGHPQAIASPLSFDASQYKERTLQVDGVTLRFRAYENISYVQKNLDPSVQVMNIYIPEAYFQGQTIHNYSAQTAPIFLPNSVGDYMPSRPSILLDNEDPKSDSRTYTMALALAKGYVVASPGTRGRTSKHASGLYIGKAPAAIVDLKAAVRYLHFNDERMPGNAEKIIANGTSAGGALSALLGATGNSSDYKKALQALGAANAPDHIFAASAYCPTTNLDHADAAYEWQFQSVHSYRKIDINMLDYKVQRQESSGTLDEDQQEVSAALAASFPAYVNSLNLKNARGEPLTLDNTGQGSFKDYIKTRMMASAQKAYQQGAIIPQYSWIKLDGNTVTDVDLNLYIAKYLGRMKTPPAFDGFNLETAENQLFGAKRIDKRHFTVFSSRKNQRSTQLADSFNVGLMNPMNYIGKPKVDNAPHWRIRMGTKDKDTSLAIPALLALALSNQGLDVDFELAWEQTHTGDYDLDELFAWMERISKI
jgi:hypothetical protein